MRSLEIAAPELPALGIPHLRHYDGPDEGRHMSIGYQSDQGVVTLTIDRPAKKNAITGEMYETFVAQPEAGGGRQIRPRRADHGRWQRVHGGQRPQGFRRPALHTAGFACAWLHAGACCLREARGGRGQRARGRHRRHHAAPLRSRVCRRQRELFHAIHEPRPGAGVCFDLAPAADCGAGARG